MARTPKKPIGMGGGVTAIDGAKATAALPRHICTSRAETNIAVGVLSSNSTKKVLSAPAAPRVANIRNIVIYNVALDIVSITAPKSTIARNNLYVIKDGK